MKLSAARLLGVALVFSLSVSAQDTATDPPLTETTDVVEDPGLPTETPTPSIPEESPTLPADPADVTTPDVIVPTDPIVPADPIVTTEDPSVTEVPTATEDLSTTDAATGTSSSEDPAATDTGGEGIEEVNPDTKEIEEGVLPEQFVTPDQWAAEAETSHSKAEMTQEQAKNIAIMETALFEEYVTNAPAPVDAGLIEIPRNVSDCNINLRKRGLLGPGTDGPGNRRRSLWGDWTGCQFIHSIDIQLRYHYHYPNRTARTPPSFFDRINKQNDLLNEVFNPIGIRFVMGGIDYWQPKVNAPSWDVKTEGDRAIDAFQRISHKGDKMTLNIWLINELLSENGGTGLYGYSFFPWDNVGKLDGIVIEQKMIRGGVAAPLIHEVGHWLGLPHSFGRMVEPGAKDCAVYSNLIRRDQTRGDRDVIFQCEQTLCTGGEPQEILNYMSYSNCAGKVPENSFSSAQKSAIFARVLEFRRGYRSGECRVENIKQTRKVKRSGMQDLIDGQCPDIEEQAEAIREDSVPEEEEEGGEDDDDNAAAGITGLSWYWVVGSMAAMLASSLALL